MRHIVSSWLSASCLVVTMAAQAAAAEPPKAPAREWNIQIHPGPTAPHPSAVSPLVSDGSTARGPIAPGDDGMTGSNSLSENLGRGGRFYFGRGNRFLNNANGTNGNGTSTGTNGVASGKTGSPPSLKGNPPRPIVSKPSTLGNHPRLAHTGGHNRNQSMLRDSSFLGGGSHSAGHKQSILRGSYFGQGHVGGGHVGGGQGLGGHSGGHSGGGHGGGGKH